MTKKNGFGIASLVLGILSLVLPVVGIPLAILGIIFAVKQRKTNPNGLATAGLITSIIGLALPIFIFLLFFILGLLSGSWSYFAWAFGSATEGTGGFEEAMIKCDIWCGSYQNAGCPESGYVYNRLFENQDSTADTNGDGLMNDCFNCLGTASCRGEALSNMLAFCEC